MFLHPELCSDPLIKSGRESGGDKCILRNLRFAIYSFRAFGFGNWRMFRTIGKSFAQCFKEIYDN